MFQEGFNPLKKYQSQKKIKKLKICFEETLRKIDTYSGPLSY